MSTWENPSTSPNVIRNGQARRAAYTVEVTQARAGWQRDRSDVPIGVLPVKVPLANVNQPPGRSIRELGDPLHLLREEMRVRLNRVGVDVRRQHVRISDCVRTLTRGYIDLLAVQTNHRGNARRRRGGEV